MALNNWNSLPNHVVLSDTVNMLKSRLDKFCQLFLYNLDCKAVATRQIPDMYKSKPNPYLNANPNANPNPTSILSKFSRKKFTLHTV